MVGIDLDHALQDAVKPIGNAKDLVDRMLSQAGKDAADLVNRVRFQVYATTGTALWVPPGIALALFGIAEGASSAVAFFPWLSSALAAEHRNRNHTCGKNIAAVAVSRLRSHRDDKAFDDARKAVPFFQARVD